MALIGENDCDLKCKGCEKEGDAFWCAAMILNDFRDILREALHRKTCDYCGKEREETKMLELDDGSRICMLCLAGEVEHAGRKQIKQT